MTGFTHQDGFIIVLAICITFVWHKLTTCRAERQGFSRGNVRPCHEGGIKPNRTPCPPPPRAGAHVANARHAPNPPQSRRVHQEVSHVRGVTLVKQCVTLQIKIDDAGELSRLIIKKGEQHVDVAPLLKCDAHGYVQRDMWQEVCLDAHDRLSVNGASIALPKEMDDDD